MAAINFVVLVSHFLDATDWLDSDHLSGTITNLEQLKHDFIQVLPKSPNSLQVEILFA